MGDILKLARIQIMIIVLFVLNKLFIRPFVLENITFTTIRIFVLSFPNFCEAIVGTLSLTYIGLFLNNKFYSSSNNANGVFFYTLVTLIAGIFIITQELNYHSLGGENVYDPYDILFSLIGLITSYLIIIILKPTITTD